MRKSSGGCFVPMVGLIFALAGVFMLYMLGIETTLTCQRISANQVNCTAQDRWLGVADLGTRSFEAVRYASVAENCDSDGCTYRVELDTEHGWLPLQDIYSSGRDEKQAVASSLNIFLQDRGRETFTITQSLGWWALFALCFCIPGVALMLGGLWSMVRGLLFGGAGVVRVG